MKTSQNAHNWVLGNRILLGLLAGTSLGSLAVPAFAQNATPAPATSSAAENPDGQKGLDEIVVTAQRRLERLQDVPSTVVSMSSNDLAQSGVTSLRDLGNVVAGFTFGGLGSTSQPAIRGVTSTLSASGAENPNALYVDGVYQSSQVALNNELPDIDRIEVLKGPQGTLFGRNATGGAIQVFTRAPSFTPQASFTVEPSYYPGSGSSHTSPRISAKGFVTGPIIPGLLAASVSAGYNYTQGYNTFDADGRQDGVIRHTNVRGKLLFTPASNLAITVGGFYIKGVEEGIVRGVPYKGLSAATAYAGSVVPTLPWHSGYDESPNSSYTTLTQSGGTARIELKADAGTITSLTGYTKTTSESGAAIAFAKGTAQCLLALACIDGFNVVNTREFSQELNFASRDFGVVSFVAGLYYYNVKVDINAGLNKGRSNIFPAFPLVVQDSLFNAKSYAVYSEVTIKPVEHLSVIFGARYNHEPHDDINRAAPVTDPGREVRRTFNSFTPRASIKYEVTDHLNVYATVSVGNKSGLTGISNTASIPPFQPVAPEKILAYEGGLKYASRDLSLNAAVFYYNYKNKQEQTFTGTTAIVQNTGPVRIFGVDFDARARLSSSLNFRGTFSWIPVAKYLNFPVAAGQNTLRIQNFGPDGTCNTAAPFSSCGAFLPLTLNATGLRLIRAPRVTASGTLSYDSGPFDASATVSYSSEVWHDITGTIRQPAYATLTAQMGYKIGDRFRVGVFGRNLTNKAYIANGLTSLAGFVVGYAPPREIGLSFGFNY